MLAHSDKADQFHYMKRAPELGTSFASIFSLSL